MDPFITALTFKVESWTRFSDLKTFNVVNVYTHLLEETYKAFNNFPTTDYQFQITPYDFEWWENGAKYTLQPYLKFAFDR